MAKPLCTKCITNWLPKALKSGAMKYDTLHPRVKAIMDRDGYDRFGNKKVSTLK